MPEEDGWTQAYRVKFTLPVGEILNKWANLESRSVPSLIQDLVIESIAHRITDQNLLVIKQRIIHGEEKV